MIIRKAVFSITFLADINFDRKGFQEIISNAMSLMGYNTARYNPWGLYEKGHKYKHLFNEDVIKKHFNERDLFKYVLFADDLNCFINNCYNNSEFEKECQDIYLSLYLALVNKFPNINIIAFDIPEDTCLYLDKF